MAAHLGRNELLAKGLAVFNVSVAQQERLTKKTKISRFKAHFGSKPKVLAKVWRDLQTTNIQEARIDPTKAFIDYFLMTIYWLKRYPTEEQLAVTFQMSEKTARKWCFYFAKRIQALKESKILWPEMTNDASPIFIMTVDGIHCSINEPKHATRSKNPAFYSHKSNGPALDYELGISVFTNQLVWMNGPFPAGQPDIKIFREQGLKDMIPQGKRVIGDNGYRGEKNIISTPNSSDPAPVRKFKSRARARHETFNARIKAFHCIKQVFRHGIDKHKVAFEAVCVICQYQLENGSALFDV
ncbi:hypothetical protein MPSEU_000066900 [Mayamaea pseudoterrestris]|nr:hypothetical protein MPSEU_000066900 [Mayamaea pseudoterrestris]